MRDDIDMNRKTAQMTAGSSTELWGEQIDTRGEALAEDTAIHPGANGRTIPANGDMKTAALPSFDFPADDGFLYAKSIRVLDIVVAALASALLSPVMLVIAALTKLDSPGPVLFRHVRIGKNRRRNHADAHPQKERRKGVCFGKPFTLFKFRTMYIDARERFPELYKYEYTDEELRTLPIKILVGRKCDPRILNGPVEVGSELVDDPRVTRLGRWLRKTSLDELPNFLNVLKGNMALVGPRPDIVDNIRYYSEEHLRKLDVKPGITGLAQVLGRGKLSFHQTNEYDVEYLKKRSFLFDLRIILKTVLVALKGDGAF